MVQFAVDFVTGLGVKQREYSRWEWSLFVSRILSLLVIWCFYIFWLDPNDPNHIYKNRELELDPTNDDIRILILEPGEWNDPIRCRLEKTGLGSDPQFVALSYAWVESFPRVQEKERKTVLDYVEFAYCWFVEWLERHRHKKILRRMRMIFGDLRKQVIYVNGRRHEVGVNLELALRHLRIDPSRANMTARGNDDNIMAESSLGKGDIALWADAVCINQDDVADRNRQVSSMREVYKKAQRVEIWLGAERDFRQDEAQARVLPKSRELSTIGDNPRGGWDIVWELTEVDESGFGDAHEVPDPTNPPLSPLRTDDEERVRKTLDTWEMFHNRPKLLRAQVDPDYTLEFFCMIHLLQKSAFDECDNGGRMPLDERIPFLKQAAARAHVLEVFREVMDRLWWNRLWVVVQETVIAKQVDVRYGRFVVPWDNLVLAAKNLKKHRHKSCCVQGFEVLPSEDVDVLMKFADIVLGLDRWRKGWTTDARRDRVEIRLLRLLWQFRDRQTSEPRDKVYALLPLVTDWGRAEKHNVVHPKYDWPVSGVYANVVRNLLSVEDSLLVLAGNARKTEKLSGELPSWAPDWSQPPEPGELARLARIALYKASGHEPLEWRILGTNEFLELKGIRHSRVKEISEVMVPETDAASYAKTQRTFQAWERLALLDDRQKAIQAYQRTGYTRETAYYKTMCMDTILPGKTEDPGTAEVDKLEFMLAEDNFGNGMRKWEDYSKKHYTLPPKGSNQSAKRAPPDPIFIGKPRDTKLGTMVDRVMALQKTVQFDSAHPGLKRSDTPQNYLSTQINETVESATVSRRFFITDSGHMGLAPPETRIGDHVFVLFGGQVPFILRNAGKKEIPRGSSVLDGRNRIPSDATAQPDDQPGVRREADTQTADRPQTPPMPRRTFTFYSTPQKRYRHRNSGCGQTECYQLIGDCYVQGLMRGEALREKDKVRGYVYLV